MRGHYAPGVSRRTQTRAIHTQSCHSHSQSNRSQPAQGTSAAPNNNKSNQSNQSNRPNQQNQSKKSKKSNQSSDPASNKAPETPAKQKTDSNAAKSSKGNPLKSILKNNSSDKKVRFADPLTMSATSSTAATRGDNTPRTRPNSPTPQAQRQRRTQPTMDNQQWEVSSDTSSNEDQNEYIPLAFHTPVRGSWDFPSTNASDSENQNRNANKGKGKDPGNLGTRRGKQPEPLRLGSPPPRYTISPGSNSPASSTSSHSTNWDADSDTDSNVDDASHDYLSAGGASHIENTHVQSYPSPTSPSTRRHANRPVEYVRVYRRTHRDMTGRWGHPEIRHFQSVFGSSETLRNTFRNHGSPRSSDNNSNNNQAANGSENANKGSEWANTNTANKRAPTPPRAAYVEDVPDDGW